MNQMTEKEKDKIYLKEVQQHCLTSGMAQSNMMKMIRESDVSQGVRSFSLNFFSYMHVFFSATALVDKMLFNPTSRYKEHHDRIVNEYEIPYQDLRTERQIRDRFEHYDERVVDWLNDPDSSSSSFTSVFPKGFIEVGQGEIKYFKHFDPLTNIITFDDLEIDLFKSSDKIRIIFERIQEVLENNEFL